MSPAKPPKQVVSMMSQREHRMHHFIWHEVRNGWNWYDDSIKSEIRKLGWEPPRPALERTATGRAPIYSNNSGEDFLYMHRQMISQVNQVLNSAGDPKYPKVVGWEALPAPGDAEYPVPPDWTLDPYFLESKSDKFFQDTMQAWEAQYKDQNWLRTVSLGQLGTRIEFTIHNRMHIRWCLNPGDMRPDVDPDNFDDIDAKWDDPSYDFLGDTYSSHVNYIFWKLHGWIDERIEDWKRANNVGEEIQWKGNWVGKIPPHPVPHSLHSILVGGHEHHDHSSEMKQMIKLILRSGIRCHFYDQIELEK